MLEMANFAAQNSDSVDPELLRALRANTLQIRTAALKALIQHTFTQAGEDIRIDAFRVASMYTGMVARITQLLQENASVLMPEFVAAMGRFRDAHSMQRSIKEACSLRSSSR
jgi:hypothetical protein